MCQRELETSMKEYMFLSRLLKAAERKMLEAISFLFSLSSFFFYFLFFYFSFCLFGCSWRNTLWWVHMVVHDFSRESVVNNVLLGIGICRDEEEYCLFAMIMMKNEGWQQLIAETVLQFIFLPLKEIMGFFWVAMLKILTFWRCWNQDFNM